MKGNPAYLFIRLSYGWRFFRRIKRKGRRNKRKEAGQGERDRKIERISRNAQRPKGISLFLSLFLSISPLGPQGKREQKMQREKPSAALWALQAEYYLLSLSLAGFSFANKKYSSRLFPFIPHLFILSFYLFLQRSKKAPTAKKSARKRGKNGRKDGEWREKRKAE